MVVLERSEAGVPTVWCDPCIAPLVAGLNSAGLRTIASCCGHGRQPANIALSDGREIIVARTHREARRVEAILMEDPET